MPQSSGRPARVDRVLVRGDTFAWLWRWSTQPAGGSRTPRDLTGYQSRFTVRDRKTGEVLMSATVGDGIALNSGGTGWVQVTRSAATTAALPPGTHDFDQEFTLPDGTVVTPVMGYLVVIADAARVP